MTASQGVISITQGSASDFLPLLTQQHSHRSSHYSHNPQSPSSCVRFSSMLLYSTFHTAELHKPGYIQPTFYHFKGIFQRSFCPFTFWQRCCCALSTTTAFKLKTTVIVLKKFIIYCPLRYVAKDCLRERPDALNRLAGQRPLISH